MYMGYGYPVSIFSIAFPCYMALTFWMNMWIESVTWVSPCIYGNDIWYVYFVLRFGIGPDRTSGPGPDLGARTGPRGPDRTSGPELYDSDTILHHFARPLCC